MSASDLLKAHAKEIKRVYSRPTSTSVKPTPNGANNDTPMLGRGLAPGSDLFFDDESPNKKKRKSTDVDKAKVCVINSSVPLALCSWAKHYSPLVPFFTQVYKWVLANLLLGVTLRWTSIPSTGLGGGGK